MAELDSTLDPATAETLRKALARKIAASATAAPPAPPQDAGILSTLAARISTDPNAFAHFLNMRSKRDEELEQYYNQLAAHRAANTSLAQNLTGQLSGLDQMELIIKNVKDLGGALGPAQTQALIARLLNVPTDPTHVQRVIDAETANTANTLASAVSSSAKGGNRFNFADRLLSDAGVISTEPTEDVTVKSYTFDPTTRLPVEHTRSGVTATGPARPIQQASSKEGFADPSELSDAELVEIFQRLSSDPAFGEVDISRGARIVMRQGPNGSEPHLRYYGTVNGQTQYYIVPLSQLR